MHRAFVMSAYAAGAAGVVDEAAAGGDAGRKIDASPDTRGSIISRPRRINDASPGSGNAAAAFRTAVASVMILWTSD